MNCKLKKLCLIGRFEGTHVPCWGLAPPLIRPMLSSLQCACLRRVRQVNYGGYGYDYYRIILSDQLTLCLFTA